MKKSLWRDIAEKHRYVETKTGGGIHTGVPPEEIPAGLAAEMENMHSRSFPQLRPRPPRDASAVPALPEGTLRFFGVIFGDTLAAVVGKKLYTLSQNTWADKGTIFTADTGRVYSAGFMDYAVFADGNECKKFDGTQITAVGTRGTPENAHFLATHAWHLFTSSDSDAYLRYSAVENIGDWSAPGDSGCELVETTRADMGSAVFAYGGHILYFKEHAMFELYGTDSPNFSLLALSGDIGCLSQASLCEIGGILYFVGADGVYRYNGGTLPKKISLPIQRFWDRMDKSRAEEIAAGSDGERYYLTLPLSGDESRVLVFDTRVGEWYCEDDAPFYAYARLGGKLYGALPCGTVCLFGEGTEAVSWSRTFAPIVSGNSLRQSWHRIIVRAILDEGASFSVALSPWLSGEGFRTVGTVEKSGQTVLEIPPRLSDAPGMRVRLSGTGDVQVTSVEFELRGARRSYI